MDIAFYHIVLHQTVNYIRAFPFCSAEHHRMPQKIALINETVYADALTLAEILEGIVRIECVAANLELLPVT